MFNVEFNSWPLSYFFKQAQQDLHRGFCWKEESVYAEAPQLLAAKTSLS